MDDKINGQQRPVVSKLGSDDQARDAERR
jgi:hypothetical protein